MFCRSLLVHFILVIALSGLFRYTYSDYPFGISKLFLGGLPLFMLSNYMSPVFRSVHRCPRKNDIRFVFTPICVVGFFLFYVICIYVRTLYVAVELPSNSYTPITNTTWVRTRLYYKTGALDSHPQVTKITSWWFSPDTTPLHSNLSGKCHTGL
jgi:uncharacterized protein with PQ loop repeat